MIKSNADQPEWLVNSTSCTVPQENHHAELFVKLRQIYIHVYIHVCICIDIAGGVHCVISQLQS